MPHYSFPSIIAKDPNLCNFQGKKCVSFKLEDRHIGELKRVGGVQLMNYGFIPVDSICFKPEISPPDVEVYKLDTSLKVLFLREKERRFENMPFPDDIEALVIDTDLPVTEQFSDNFCGYCTGMIGKKTHIKWMNLFYDELSINDEPSPFASKMSIVRTKDQWHPSSPWPTPSWNSDGVNGYAHAATNKLLNGNFIDMKEMLSLYQWPARMSIAFFFNKKLDSRSFLFSLLKARAERFCRLHPNVEEGKIHTIQDIRWVNPSALRHWHEYDKETFSKACTAARTRIKSVCSVKSNSYFGRKAKIEIEEISNATHDL